MRNPRKYGKPPFQVAVIHGGPGAAGEMAPVARRLGAGRGVLEPIQTATTLEGQAEELKILLENHGDIPLNLIGFSWGAWLSCIVSARYPALVKKLILVGSGPFEEKYAAKVRDTRMRRFSADKRAEFEDIVSLLANAVTGDKDALLSRLGALAQETDILHPIKEEKDQRNLVEIRGDIFRIVWKEAAELRRSGKLLELVKLIICPVVAIHGDYDPHPAEGVQRPISAVLKNFRFILLKDCGHRPWIERQAKEKFYRILEAELG